MCAVRFLFSFFRLKGPRALSAPAIRRSVRAGLGPPPSPKLPRARSTGREMSGYTITHPPPSLSLTSSTSLSSPINQPLPPLRKIKPSSIRTSENDGGGGHAPRFVVGGLRTNDGLLSLSKRQNFEIKEVRAVDPGRLGWCRLPARHDPATPGAGVVGLHCPQRPSRACRGAPGYGSRADAVKPVLRRGQFRSY